MEIGLEIPQNTRNRTTVLASILECIVKGTEANTPQKHLPLCVCWHTIHNGQPGSGTNLEVHPQMDAERERGTYTQWNSVQLKS